MDATVARCAHDQIPGVRQQGSSGLQQSELVQGRLTDEMLLFQEARLLAQGHRRNHWTRSTGFGV
jgi:hypothetical protein